jgi:type IV secretory pathway VirB2 component (pilin)
MSFHRTVSRSLTITSLSLLALLAPATAFAVESGEGGAQGEMPWESTFGKILQSIHDLAPVFATLAFLIAGVIWMFGESGGMSRKAVGLVVGGAIVFGAAPMVTKLFESGSGLLF